MCGLVAWLGPDAPTAPAALAEATAALTHRGPDEHGHAAGDGWAMGFRRLRILDLSSTGHQPMSTPDGRYWLTFNGEIYNYRELRASLVAQGVRLRSTGDTEVLLHLLAMEGPEALHRCNGMFALTFVDTRERTFLLARDRLGVKPLWLHRGRDGLRVASELKALLALPGATRELDPTAVVRYLGLGYLAGDDAILAGYSKLPPATWLAGSLDDPTAAAETRYWSVTVRGQDTEVDLEELAELTEDAVRLRLRSDVPVGVFLSGGIDSGLVAAFAASATDGEGPLALTASFPGDPTDETDLARATAEHLGLPHRTVVQNPAALSQLDALAWSMDEPLGDRAAIATYALGRTAADHGRVFLSGDGGDEAFAGYRRYLEARRRLPAARALRHLAGPTRAALGLLPTTSAARFRLHKALLPDDGFAAWFDAVSDDPVLQSALAPDLRSQLATAGRAVSSRWATTRGQDLTDRQRDLDYALYLPEDVLVKVDRMSMAHSIEVRSPFLDHRLVTFAAKLGATALIDQHGGKRPLRQLAATRLPTSVTHAAKRGFDVPLGTWFRSRPGIELLHERLIDAEHGGRGLWDPDGVRHLLDHHQRPRGRSFADLLWRLLLLDAWIRAVVDREHLASSRHVATLRGGGL